MVEGVKNLDRKKEDLSFGIIMVLAILIIGGFVITQSFGKRSARLDECKDECEYRARDYGYYLYTKNHRQFETKEDCLDYCVLQKIKNVEP